jgi:uncharacterized membrane protein YtjA (UPF0391 family)
VFGSFLETFGQHTPANLRRSAAILYYRKRKPGQRNGDKRMLKWAAIFLVIALFAALFGFVGIAGVAADIAKFLFFLFIAIFVIFLLLGIFAGKKLF